LARAAMDEVKDPHKTYIYMRIKQSTEEPLGKFVNQLLKRIKKARVPLYMQRAMLKQCILQNSNQATKNLVNTLRANGSVEEALEKGASVPSRPQAFIVEAIKRLGETFQKQAESSQAQVFATLAPLQCYCCEAVSHFRRECPAGGVWCQKCCSDTHNTGACRRKLRNGKTSAPSSHHAETQIAAV
ncbi:hypothetical protein HGM15179_020179, partial [Zosterops borbonicus]